MHCSGHHLRQMNVAKEVHIIDHTLTLPHSALATVHMFNKTSRNADDQCLHRKTANGSNNMRKLQALYSTGLNRQQSAVHTSRLMIVSGSSGCMQRAMSFRAKPHVTKAVPLLGCSANTFSNLSMALEYSRMASCTPFMLSASLYDCTTHCGNSVHWSI